MAVPLFGVAKTVADLFRYRLERLLRRLSLSPHRERFVLNGALLMTTWFDETARRNARLRPAGFSRRFDTTKLKTQPSATTASTVSLV